MKRRAFLRSAALGATALGTAGFAAEKPDKPNILFIFADDQCHEAIRAFGQVDIDTPNLDKLVKRGTTFTHAYNMGAYSGAVCVASRAMLNTGRSLWNTNKLDFDQEIQQGNMWSQQIKSAGYTTYFTGKWHVKAPAEKVFDVTADIRGGMPKQTKEGYNRPKSKDDYETGWKPWDAQHGGFWEGGKHWSEIVGDHSVRYLETAAKDDNPFFMYLAFNAPHDPRQSPKEYVDKYPLDRIPVPENALPEYPYADAICGKDLRDEKLAPYPRTEFSIKVNRQEYYAIITHMDAQVGRILDALEKSGKADNTYIFFTADHGLSVGQHGLLGKQNMYDHSVRVPFIINGPGIPAKKSIDAPIYLQDIMPTTLELAGVPKPEQVFFNSIMPLIQGKRAGSYESIYGAYKDRQRMITKNGWKLLHYPSVPVDRLFNLKDDPQEMNDLANNPEYAGKIKELKTALTGLQKQMNDPLLFGSAPTGKKKKKKRKKS